MKKLVFVLIVVLSMPSFAQDDALAKYKAMFTLNFIRYIGWPDASKQGDFVVGIVRESDIAEKVISQTAGKTFYNQNIVVKEFKSVEEITDCQVLYFSSRLNFGKNAALVKQKLMGKNSLIVTETEGAIDDGSMINFVIRDDKLKFEISSANAEVFGLKFSSSLTSLSNAIVK